jgi:uncharacterized protein YuzE
MIRQSYDLDADALYIKLTDAKVVRSRDIDSGTLVNLDADGAIVGIEVIQPQRSWPLAEILARFPVPGGTAAQLRAYFQEPAQLRAPLHPAVRVPVAVG